MVRGDASVRCVVFHLRNSNKASDKFGPKNYFLVRMVLKFPLLTLSLLNSVIINEVLQHGHCKYGRTGMLLVVAPVEMYS